MAARDPNAAFTDVDRAADPQRFVQLLDAIAGLDAIAEQKRATLALLELGVGDRVLEAGCGTGDDVLAAAGRVGPSGLAIGLDRGATMVAQARERAAGTGLPAAYLVGDCHALPFPDGTFAGCRADRVLHHLDDPARAVRELARVARPGGRVVVTEPDTETLIVDGPGRETTRAILHHYGDSLRNDQVGRSLARLYREAGLIEVAVAPRTLIVTDHAVGAQLFGLERSAAGTVASGHLPAEEAARWLRGVAALGEAGNFFAAITLFTVSGRRPRHPGLDD